MAIKQFNSELLELSADWRYYAWRRHPDWSQGVVYQWRPVTGETVSAEASIVPLAAPEDPTYIEVIPTLRQGSTDNASTDNPFDHLRVKETGTGGQFWIMSTGELEEVDPTGTPY